MEFDYDDIDFRSYYDYRESLDSPDNIMLAFGKTLIFGCIFAGIADVAINSIGAHWVDAAWIAGSIASSWFLLVTLRAIVRSAKKGIKDHVEKEHGKEHRPPATDSYADATVKPSTFDDNKHGRSY